MIKIFSSNRSLKKLWSRSVYLGLFLLFFSMLSLNAAVKKAKDKVKLRNNEYVTYYWYNGDAKAIESLNSYSTLKSFIAKGSSILSVREKDLRVVQDLCLDKNYKYLTRIPIYSYTDLATAKEELSDSIVNARVEQFKKFRNLIKKYGAFERAIKQNAFWQTLKDLADEASECLNYKVLLAWKSGKLIKRFSYVTSVEKLFEYNAYYCKYFVVEKNVFKGFRFTLFKSYPAIERTLKKMRSQRFMFSSNTVDLYKNIYAFGEYTLRYDAQYGRIKNVDRDYENAKKRYNVDKNVGTYNREIDRLNRKIKSFNKLISDIERDALKVDRSYEMILRKHVHNLRKY